MRDYDKYPIIIKDYNYIFVPLGMFLVFLWLLYIIINSTTPISAGATAVCGAAVSRSLWDLYWAYDARKIVLSNSSIKFLQNNRIIEEIKINDIMDVRKTYTVSCHKSQYPNSDINCGSSSIFSMFLPITFVAYLPIIIFKFFFHLLKDGWKSYHFFDAIIVFSKDGLINILPVTKNEYEEVRKYFMLKKPVFDIQNAKIYWNICGNGYEKIKYKDTP
jgi:hypothetical protein